MLTVAAPLRLSPPSLSLQRLVRRGDARSHSLSRVCIVRIYIYISGSSKGGARVYTHTHTHTHTHTTPLFRRGRGATRVDSDKFRLRNGETRARWG